MCFIPSTSKHMEEVVAVGQANWLEGGGKEERPSPCLQTLRAFLHLTITGRALGWLQLVRLWRVSQHHRWRPPSLPLVVVPPLFLYRWRPPSLPLERPLRTLLLLLR